MIDWIITVVILANVAALGIILLAVTVFAWMVNSGRSEAMIGILGWILFKPPSGIEADYYNQAIGNHPYYGKPELRWFFRKIVEAFR